jgi:peptidyl-prolyl cis-trans isomerase C
MMKKALILILIELSLFFLLGLPGCDSLGKKELGSKELVRINDATISIEEFRSLSERQPLESKMRLISEKGLRDFLENYVITREVLYQEASRKGYDRNQEVMAKVENYKRAMVIDALLEEALKGKLEISDGEVERFYKENSSRFSEPREVKIRHIIINSEPVLREVLMKLGRGVRFENLAMSYNIDRSRADGGDLGYLRRGQLAPSFAQFEEAAFSLKKKGQISEVVTTPSGFHILRLEDSRGTALKPFEKVKEELRFFLRNKKKQDAYLEYVKELKSRSKIRINEKLWAEEEEREQKPQEEKK